MYANIFTKPIVSSAAAGSALSGPVYEQFARVIDGTSRSCLNWVQTIAAMGWSQIALVSSSETFAIEYVNCFIRNADKFRLTILASVIFSEEMDLDQIVRGLKPVKDSGARIIFYASSTSVLPKWEAFVRAELTGPPYVIVGSNAVGNLVTGNAQVPADVIQANVGNLGLVPALGLTDDPRFQRILEAVAAADVPASVFMGLAFDAVLAFDAALGDLVEAVGAVADVEQAQLIGAIKAAAFDGVTGRVSFLNDTGERAINPLLIVNFQRDGDAIVSVEVGRTDVVNGASFTAPIVFPDGTEDKPDDTPRMAVVYFDCHKGQLGRDSRGLVFYDSLEDSDPRYILPDFECDGVIDCNDWSDEAYGCSPSIRVANIIFQALAGLFILLCLVSVVFVILFRDRARLKISGILYLLTLCVGGIIGLSAVFVFTSGRLNDIACGFQVWLLTFGSAFVVSGLVVKVAACLNALLRTDSP